MAEETTSNSNLTESQEGAPLVPRKMWLSDLSIKQPVFITMILVATVVIGSLFYSRMGLDLLPDISLPIVAVRTVYPGADPQEVERAVTKAIEDTVSSISGVESVASTSMDSVSAVVIEFKMTKNPKEATDDVRAKVNAVRNTLPADVKEPVILNFDPSASPILSIAVADKTGNHPLDQLRTLVDDSLKTRIERVEGVAAADVSGGLIREIHIDLKQGRLEAYGIPVQQVIQSIRTENLDVPGGRVPSGQMEELVRTAGVMRSLDQLKAVPIAVRGGNVAVKVRDIADVNEGYAEQRYLSRLDGRPSVIVEVRKQSGTNTVQVVDAVKQELAKLQQENPDLEVAIATDQSTFTREAVQDVQTSLLLGAILATLIVFLFFRDLRNTLVTVAGLPVILLGTFGVLYMLGISINMITMIALSLSVGMLIDDAIVVRENIFRHMERGEEPKAAAGHGTAEIALAVVAVSSTIVAVFLPIAFTEGIAGKIFRDFGITITVAVVISLIEAFTLAPMLSAYFFHRIVPGKNNHSQDGRFGRLFGSVNSAYRGLLIWSLRHRVLVVIIGLAALIGSLAVVPLMNRSFIPETDQGEFNVKIELAPGVRLEETERAVKAVERLLEREPSVAHVFTRLGSIDGAVERATLNVKLKERGQTKEVIARLRPAILGTLSGIKASVDPVSTGSMMTSGTIAGTMRSRPILYSVQAGDSEVLDRVSAELVNRLSNIPNVVDVERSIRAGKPSRTIVLDRGKANDLNVTTAQVGTAIRALINGERVGVYRDANKDIDVIVRLAEEDRNDPASLLRLPMITGRGSQVPLSAFAYLTESIEPDQITREDRQRQTIVGAGFLGRSQGAVQTDVRAVIDSMNLPPGVTIEPYGEAQYTEGMFSSLGLALALSVLFVYMILASQFGSFVHPLTIMLALPFSIIGALLSLFAARFDLDMLGMIGIILLMGLVTKNSILLVEFANQLKHRGFSTRDAILEAGPIRLRPILMTTLAMIFGMIPVAMGLGAGSEFRRPMGVSVIGGLITSTILTLIVVPVAYSLIDDISRLFNRRRLPGTEPNQHIEKTA